MPPREKWIYEIVDRKNDHDQVSNFFSGKMILSHFENGFRYRGDGEAKGATSDDARHGRNWRLEGLKEEVPFQASITSTLTVIK